MTAKTEPKDTGPRRVWHPTLDVSRVEQDVDGWKAAGWLLTKPSHASDPGEESTYQPPPVIDVTSSAPIPTIIDNTPDGATAAPPVTQ